MVNESITKLTRLVPLEGWEAIKSCPVVLSMITKSAGIINSSERDLEADELVGLFQDLSLQDDPSIIFICCTLALDDELRLKALSLLSTSAKIISNIDHVLVFEFISISVFVRRPDGLNFILAARLLSIIQPILYSNQKFILDGLNHEDGIVRKQSLFMLKYIIVTAPKEGSENVLMYEKESLKSWNESWSTFFLLYDTFQEPQSHLLEPLFPLLHSFLMPDGPRKMGFSWWECIVRRAFNNTSVAVRKRVLEHIIIELPIQEYPVLCKAESFVFSSLLRLIDNSYLYSAIDFTRLVSPFGLSVTRFWTKYLSLVDSEEERFERVKRFFSVLKELTSNLAIVFILNSFLEIKTIDGLLSKDADLEVFNILAEHCGFHNSKARSMLRWQLIQVLVKFSRAQDFAIDKLCATLGLLVSEVEINKKEIETVSVWFCSNESAQSQLLTEIDSILFSSEDSIVKLSQRANNLSLGMALLCREGRGGPESTVGLLSGINKALAEKDYNLLFKCCALLNSLEASCKRLANLSFTHGVISQPKLFSMLSMLESLILPEFPLSIEVPISSVMNSMQTLVSELISLQDLSVNRMLIEFMDILAIKLAQLIERPLLESSLKIGICGMTKLVFDCFNQVEYPSKDTLNQEYIVKMIRLALFKSPTMSDDELQFWPLLKDTLAGSKWGAVNSFCKHVADIQESDCSKLSVIYEIILESIPDSHCNEAVSMIGCLSTILGIFSQRFEQDLVFKMCSRSWDCLKTFLESMEDDNSRWFNIYAGAVVDCLLQDRLISVISLHDSGPIRDLVLYFLRQVGPNRRGLLPFVMMKMYEPMRRDSHIRRAYFDIMPELLMYGPVRNVPEERLADAMQN